MRHLATIGDTVMTPRNVQGVVTGIFRISGGLDSAYDTMIVTENTPERYPAHWSRNQLLVQREAR